MECKGCKKEFDISELFQGEEYIDREKHTIYYCGHCNYMEKILFQLERITNCVEKIYNHVSYMR